MPLPFGLRALILSGCARARTEDLMLKGQLLFRLSYTPNLQYISIMCIAIRRTGAAPAYSELKVLCIADLPTTVKLMSVCGFSSVFVSSLSHSFLCVLLPEMGLEPILTGHEPVVLAVVLLWSCGAQESNLLFQTYEACVIFRFTRPQVPSVRLELTTSSL